MWMARGQQETRLQEPGAEWGEVTLSGETVGVSLAGERRRVRVCLPGGYHWVPDRGETVLVVKSGPEEAPCVVGGQVEESIRPGEVWISVAPGAGIRLTKEGTIQLQGRVEVEGSLWLQGQEVRG